MTNRLFYLTFLFGSLFLVQSCTDTAPASSDHTDTTAAEVVDTIPSLAAPSCAIAGDVLDGNRLWVKSLDVLALIKADSTTASEELGPSHRIFEILDGRTCESKFTTTLPENTSPDFPYYIANIQYNNINNLVGIRGYYDLLLCDLDKDYQISKLSPKYYSEREFDDPQSGMIQRIEVWEDYLLGYAQDLGPFAFDLSDNSNPAAVLPFAEWKNTETGTYHSLFLLSTDKGTQAIMPFFDAGKDAFMLYPLFAQPETVSTNMQKSARNNKFLVLRKTDEARTPLAINMATRQLVTLPAEVATKETQQILAWLRTQ